MQPLRLLALSATTLALVTLSLASTAAAHPHEPAHPHTVQHKTPSAQTVEHRYETLKAKRARLLQALKDYRARGVFPDNRELSKPLAVFIDRHGVPCAFANLMIQDGHGATVRHIAQTNNNLLVSNVTSGPVLDWVLSSGFTLEEAAQIQVPGFMYRPPRQPVHPVRPEPMRPDPSVVKRTRIQESLAKTIQSLESSTHRSLLLATARSFPHDRLSTRSVAGLLSQAVYERTRNDQDPDRAWVNNIVARSLGNATPAPPQPAQPSKKLSKDQLRDRVNATLQKRSKNTLDRDTINSIIARRLNAQ